jgi:hypothetical protein
LINRVSYWGQEGLLLKILRPILLIILFITVTVFGIQIISKAVENQNLKKNYAELHHFKYGLFSVDTWKQQLSVIVSDEIENLALTKQNERDLKGHLETQLGILIDKIAIRMKNNNKNSTEGWLKQSFIDAFINVGDIKKGIPQYATAMLNEMKSTQAEKQIKSLLKSKVDHYIKNTFDVRDNSLKEEIIKNSGAGDEEAAKNLIEKRIIRNHHIISEYAIIIVSAAILVFLIVGFTKGPLSELQYFTLTFTLIMLLIVGVMTPMIDMEAKISQLNFVLFNHPIHFDNQILYFQSKSIIDVFWLMITHKEIQMKLVGILMVGFSIIFPLIKMLSSVAYYYDYLGARKNKILNFFVMKSGKWSMADVMVVSIFMAFIGFNGIINSQLGQLRSSSEDLQILTTNGTNLQPGFYLFFTYTMLAMFMSNMLKSRPKGA